MDRKCERVYSIDPGELEISSHVPNDDDGSGGGGGSAGDDSHGTMSAVASSSSSSTEGGVVGLPRNICHMKLKVQEAMPVIIEELDSQLRAGTGKGASASRAHTAASIDFVVECAAQNVVSECARDRGYDIPAATVLLGWYARLLLA